MKRLLLMLTTAALLTLFGCTNTAVNLPAVTTQNTGATLPGKVIWHDLVSEDPAAAKRFYGQLFGWTFTPLPGGKYSLIMHRGTAIGGLVDAGLFKQKQNVSQWVVVLSVGDVASAVAKVKQSGGTVLGGPTDMGDRGTLAVVKDPQGATVALLQTRDGDPVDREAANGEFMWHELWTSQPAKATEFYQQVASYTAGQHAMADGGNYKYLQAQGHPRAAIIANPMPGLDPTWVAYVKVADTDAITAQVEQLGGKILLPSQTNKVGGELAIIADPSGAGLVIQTWNNSKQEL